MSAAEIVPIAVHLDERTGYTLWASPWEEDGEEWQAFLGADDKVLLFDSPAQLAQYLRKGEENDLSDHPDWEETSELDPFELVPSDEHTYDLDGVYDLVASGADRWSVRELGGVFDIVARLAECCDDDIVEPIEDVPEIGLLQAGSGAFLGRSGDRAWDKIGLTLAAKWETVCERLGAYLDWREPAALDADLAQAQEEIDRAVVPIDDPEALIAAETEVADEDDEDPIALATRPDSDLDEDDDEEDEDDLDEDDLADDDEDDDGLDEDEALAYAFWEEAGILPVKLTFPDEPFDGGEAFTLRCYLDDDPVFMGHRKKPWIFRSPDTLLDVVEDPKSRRGGSSNHDLMSLATWRKVMVGVRDDDQPLAITVEDDIDLASADAMVRGDIDFDPAEFARAADFLVDIADYADLDDVRTLLEDDGALADLTNAARDDEVVDVEDDATLITTWETVLKKVAAVLDWID